LDIIANHVHTLSVEDASLASVAARCKGISSKDVYVNFLVMVNYMTLVFKCQRLRLSQGLFHSFSLSTPHSIRLKTGLTLKGIYRSEITNRPSSASRISYRTFLDWYAIGSKFVAIACGGSIYVLVLIAGLGLRVAIANMVGTTHLQLADLLRSPPKGRFFFWHGVIYANIRAYARFSAKGFDYQPHCTDSRTHAYCIPTLHVVNVL
jgi:hypothetical protein